MLQRNREIKTELTVFIVLTGLLSLFGSRMRCGLPVLLTCFVLGAFYFLCEWMHYRKLQKLSTDLDHLLTEGIPLPIRDYCEGELSVLSTQIQKMTLRLTEAADTLRADKIYLADSLADISHQLRTPLTAMNLTAAMLSEPALSDDRRQELTLELKRLLSRTQWLVETLLKLSRLDAGTAVMERETVPVEQLIQKAALPLAIPLELRDQQLLVNCSGNVCADPIWTAEAIGNILKNCMEHTPCGGCITVTAEETALFTRITVEDTGPGLHPEDIPHLFERFYKGKNASESSYGIGLALARTVITSQNGTIQAANCATGAQFIMKFYKQVI